MATGDLEERRQSMARQLQHAAVHAAAVDVQGKCMPGRLAQFWRLFWQWRVVYLLVMVYAVVQQAQALTV